MMMAQMNPEVADLVEVIKKNILFDVATGVVPNTVQGFAELHDFVDANMYAEPDEAVKRDESGELDDLGYWDAFIGRCNLAFDNVDAWIKEGGLHHGV